MVPQPCTDTSGEAFCPLPTWARLLLTFGPIFLFGIFVAIMYSAYGQATVWFILSVTVGGFVGGGKLVILAGAVESAPIGVWPIAGLVVFGDMATALVIIANMHHLYRVPALGRRLAAARAAGFRVLKTHPWMRRAAELGLTVFVAAPFQGSGAVLGVMLGRILGLSRTVILLSTFLGASIGASLVALVGKAGEQKITFLAQNPILGVASIVVSLTITFFLGKWFIGQTQSESETASENQNTPEHRR